MKVRLYTEIAKKTSNPYDYTYSYNDIGFYEIIDRNIVMHKPIPGSSIILKYAHFTIDESNTYSHKSNGTVNTRINIDVAGESVYVYCKLNWIRLEKLKYLNREGVMQKHPLQVIALFVSIIGLIVNFYLDYRRVPSEAENKTNQERIQDLEQKILSKNYEAFRERSKVALDSIIDR